MKIKLPLLYIAFACYSLVINAQNANTTEEGHECLFEEMLHSSNKKYGPNYNRVGQVGLKSGQISKIDSIVTAENGVVGQSLLKNEREVFVYDKQDRVTGYTINKYNEKLNDWVNYRKTLITYDQTTGYDGVHITYVWDKQQSVWRQGYKHRAKFNVTGQLLLSINYNWNEELKIWEGTSKYQREYNNSGNVTFLTIYYWDHNLNNWHEHHIWLYTYNAQGKCTSDEHYLWDKAQNKLSFAKREVYTYNAAEQLLSTEKYEKVNNVWEKLTKSVNNYDVNDFKIQMDFFQWDSFISDWVLTKKEVFANDNSGNVLERSFLNWDEHGSKWVNDSKEVFTNDINGNAIENIVHKWNLTLDVWEVYWKTEKSYTASGIVLSEMGYSWDKLSASWKGTNKWVEDFNENGEKTLEEHYYWNSTLGDWKGILKSVYGFNASGLAETKEGYAWDATSNSWYLSSKRTTYYEPIPTFTKNLQADSYRLYPNPSYGAITVEGEMGTAFTVRIYNMAGAMLGTVKSKASRIQFDLNAYGAKGIYLLELSNDQTHAVEVKKVILK